MHLLPQHSRWNPDWTRLDHVQSLKKMTMEKTVSWSQVRLSPRCQGSLQAGGEASLPKYRVCKGQGWKPEYRKQEGRGDQCWVDPHKCPLSHLWTLYGNREVKCDQSLGVIE